MSKLALQIYERIDMNYSKQGINIQRSVLSFENLS